MGFGNLFIGYFLLLNLTYYGFTDLIAASVMLLGLYKLSKVNRYFSYAAIATVVFLSFSFAEFGISTYNIFASSANAIDSPFIVSFTSILRSMCIGLLTVLILKGIEEIAKEVELEDVPTKASRLVIITAVTYTAWIILEARLSFINHYVLGVLSFITIVATIALIIVNLTVIYTCYMRICMPGDESLTDKPSRFAFVNEYRARKAERDREDAEKRLEALRKKMEKKKGQKK